jgi:hypothetical protein
MAKRARTKSRRSKPTRALDLQAAGERVEPPDTPLEIVFADELEKQDSQKESANPNKRDQDRSK